MAAASSRLRLSRAARWTSGVLLLAAVVVVALGTVVGLGLAGTTVVAAIGRVSPADVGATISQLAALPALFAAAIVFGVREAATPGREQAGWIATALASVGVAAAAMSTLYRNSESLLFVAGFGAAAAALFAAAGFVVARAVAPGRFALAVAAALASGMLGAGFQLWLPGILALVVAAVAVALTTRAREARSAA